MAVRIPEQEPVQTFVRIEIPPESLAHLDQFIEGLREDEQTIASLVDPGSAVRTNYTRVQLLHGAGRLAALITQYQQIRRSLGDQGKISINRIFCSERVCEVDIGAKLPASMTLEDIITLAVVLSPEKPLQIEDPLRHHCPVILRLVNSDGHARTA